MNFLQNQTHKINDIYLFLYKNDKKYFTYNFSELKIVSVDKNLRAHLKYFFAMTLYIDYAIITLDDDVGYAINTFEILSNSYI
jgi:hypothetical protein